mgnify:CR=1 FL=1
MKILLDIPETGLMTALFRWQPGTALPLHEHVEIEQTYVLSGSIVSVDTTPWTYDGSAVVKIASANGQVDVHLPARWNLCKAPPPDDVQSLKAGDRVQATGTVTEDGALVVCESADHVLRKLP